MGKKSKRARNKSGSGNKDEANANVDGSAAVRSIKLLKEALEAISFDRLCVVYKEVLPLLQQQIARARSSRLVTDADLKQDPDGARQTMEAQIVSFLPAGPFNKTYETTALQELKSMGGIKILCVTGRKKSESFAYTCGFASVGGKELFLRKVHRSMLDKEIHYLFNMLYKDHNEGKPVDDGHTIACESLAFTAHALESAEAVLIKATKTLEPTRLFGIANYDILEIVPVGFKSDYDNKEDLTGEEVLRMAIFHDFKAKGYQCTQGKVEKLEACAMCHKKRDTAVDMPLMKCTGCRNAFYCSRECQRLHWKDHKPICRGSSRDDVLEYVKPFLPFDGEDDDDVLRKLESVLGNGGKM